MRVNVEFIVIQTQRNASPDMLNTRLSDEPSEQRKAPVSQRENSKATTHTQQTDHCNAKLQSKHRQISSRDCKEVIMRLLSHQQRVQDIHRTKRREAAKEEGEGIRRQSQARKAQLQTKASNNSQVQNCKQRNIRFDQSMVHTKLASVHQHKQCQSINCKHEQARFCRA